MGMCRSISSSAITATMTPIIAEPVVTSAVVHCILRIEGWRQSRTAMQRQVSNSSSASYAATQGRPPNDPFLLASDLVCERVISEEEWTKGKSLQISGLEPSTGSLLRLIATNDAGTTHGEIVEVFTKAPKDSGRANLRSFKEALNAEQASVVSQANTEAALTLPSIFKAA